MTPQYVQNPTFYALFLRSAGGFITKKDVLCGSIVLKFLIFPVVVVVIM
jgi:hypothetical protein